MSSKVKSVVTAPVNPVTPEDAGVHAMLAAAAARNKRIAEAKAALAKEIEEANREAEANGKALAEAKENRRLAAVAAVEAYKSLVSEVEYKAFGKALGLGGRETKPCEECGAGRHGSKSTCSKR